MLARDRAFVTYSLLAFKRFISVRDNIQNRQRSGCVLTSLIPHSTVRRSVIISSVSCNISCSKTPWPCEEALDARALRPEAATVGSGESDGKECPLLSCRKLPIALDDVSSSQQAGNMYVHCLNLALHPLRCSGASLSSFCCDVFVSDKAESLIIAGWEKLGPTLSSDGNLLAESLHR